MFFRPHLSGGCHLLGRLVQQLDLGPLLAAWADAQLATPAGMEDIGPQVAKLLAAVMTGERGRQGCPQAFSAHRVCYVMGY